MATKTATATEVAPDDEKTPVVPPSGPGASIHQRMVAIVAELPAIGKTQRNAQQNFMFRGHDDVMNALNPLLSKHGVFLIPDVYDRVTSERTTRNGAVMYEVSLHVRYTLYGACGDSVSGSVWGEGTDMGDKATNKAMTMAFKAMIAQAFAISTGEYTDSDADTPEETVPRGRRPPAASKPALPEKASLEDVAKLIELLAEEGTEQAQIDSAFAAIQAQNGGVLPAQWIAEKIAAAEKRRDERVAAAEDDAAEREDAAPTTPTTDEREEMDDGTGY